MLLVRIASGSDIQDAAVRNALEEYFPGEQYELFRCPVEIGNRTDMVVNKQPIGLRETTSYANLQMDLMRQLYPDQYDLEISVIYGVLEDMRDIAVIVFRANARQLTVVSKGIEVPAWAYHQMLHIGPAFGATIGGEVNRRFPDAPEEDWMSHFTPFISREEQVRDAIVAGLKLIYPAL